MADPERAAAAVYVSWKTFQNALDQLSKAELPNVIDKTVFPGMAFSIQNQLFTGMRFLGLIDDKNRPTDQLEKLSTYDEQARKALLKQILQNKYSDLFALNLKKTTPDEFKSKMADAYGVSGETRDRAVRFFVGAAEYLAIEMSSLFSSKKSIGGTRPPKKRPMPRKVSITETAVEPSGTSKTVHLQSGGTLTLSATLDLFSLNADDRKFVFEFIDKLDGYIQPEQSAAAE